MTFWDYWLLVYILGHFCLALGALLLHSWKPKR